jgi:hypothetical protein
MADGEMFRESPKEASSEIHTEEIDKEPGLAYMR